MSKVFEDTEDKQRYISEFKRLLNINNENYDDVIDYDLNKNSKWYNIRTLIKSLELCGDDEMAIIGTLCNYSCGPCDYGFEIEEFINEPEKHEEIIEEAAAERLDYVKNCLLNEFKTNIVDFYQHIIELFDHEELIERFDPCEIEYIEDDYELLSKINYEEICDVIIAYCKDDQVFNLQKIMGYGLITDLFNDLVHQTI